MAQSNLLEQLKTPLSSLQIAKLVQQAPKRDFRTAELARAVARGVNVFKGRSSLPLLDEFDLFIFRAPSREVFGYIESPASPFIGAAYFGVVEQQDRSVILDFDITPKPGDQPKGAPDVNRSLVAGLAFGGLKISVRQLADVEPETYVGEASRSQLASAVKIVLVRQPD